MKAKIILYLTVILLLVGLVSANEYYLVDTFEDGDSSANPAWGGSPTIYSDSAMTGTYYIDIDGGGYHTVSFNTSTASTTYNLSFQARDDDTADTTYIGISTNGGSSVAHGYWCAMGAGTFKCFNSSTLTSTSHTFSGGTNYVYSMIINTTAGTFEVYTPNGYEGLFTGRGTLTGARNVAGIGDLAGHEAFFDNVQVQNFTAQTVGGAPPAGNTTYFLLTANNNYGSSINNFNVSIEGYRYYLPASTSEYEFNFTTVDSVGSNDGVLSGYTIYNGTATNGLVLGNVGYRGNGAFFDGVNDYMLTNDNGQLFETKLDWTISAWVNVTDAVTYLWGYTGASSNQRTYAYVYANRLYCYISNGTAYVDTANTIELYTPSEWNHFACKRDGSNGIWSACVNGVCHNKTLLGNGVSGTLGYDFELGKWSANYFNGTMDEVRIFNKSLSSTEINLEMNSRLPIETNTLLASWDFDHYAGVIVEDTNPYVNGTFNSSAMRFDGVDKQIIISDDYSLDIGTGDFSVCIWSYKIAGSTAPPTLIKKGNSFNSNAGYTINFDNTNPQYLQASFGNGSNAVQLFKQLSSDISNQWVHTCLVLDRSNNLTSYFNGVKFESKDASSLGGDIDSTDSLYIGSRGYTRYWNGSIDDVRIFNRSLNITEINSIYSNSEYSSITVNLSTSTGTINTSINSSLGYLVNLTLNSENYFSQEKLSVNTSSNYLTTFIQSQINFTAYEKFTGNQIYNFTITDGNISQSTTNGTVIINLLAGNKNITFNNTLGYYNITNNYSFSALANTTFNFSNIYNNQYTVKGFNYSGGNLSNMSVSINYSGVLSENHSVNTNSIILNLTNGVAYDLYVTSQPDFTINHHTNNKVVTANTTNTNSNFTLFFDRSLFLTAKDILTDVLIDNVQLYLFGVKNYNFTFNQTFFSGSLNVSSYDLLAQSSGFGDYTNTITISDMELTNLTALMTNFSQDVIFIVYDVYGNPIPGASITVYRSSDASIVKTDTTDGFGEAEFSLNSLLSYELYVEAGSFYTVFNESFSVIEDTYTVTLDFASTKINYYTGLYYKFTPVNQVPLNNGSIYNFSLNFSSDDFTVNGCWFYLYNDSNLIFSNNSFCDTSSGFTMTEVNVSNYDNIKINGIIQLNDTNITVFKYYSVKRTYTGDYSLVSWLNRVMNYDKAGFGGFARFLIAMIVIIGSVMYAANQIQTANKSTGILVFITLGAFIASYFSLITIPNVPFGGQYLIATLLGFLTITNIVMEEKG